MMASTAPVCAFPDFTFDPRAEVWVVFLHDDVHYALLAPRYILLRCRFRVGSRDVPLELLP